MALSVMHLPSPGDTVAEATALLGGLAGLDWPTRSSGDLVATVEALQATRSAIRALEARLLAELEARGTARGLGWGTTSAWLGHLAGLRRGDAKRMVDHSVELVAERPATLTALTAGAISPEQVDVILDAVEGLPSAPGLRERAEASLIEKAGSLDATDLQRAGRVILEEVDADRTGRSRERRLNREDRVAHARRFLTIVDDDAGGVRITGRGSAEDGTLLRTLLIPQTKPRAAVDPITCEREQDTRDFGVRMWDALIETAQHALDTDRVPDSHGARTRVSITTDLATLRGEAAHRGVCEDGTELAPAVVRRLLCDADIIPMVLGSESQVLDVGRTQRLVTAPLWRALVCRDGHCVFPGCHRPPVMCHAHHVIPWLEGGATALGNLVMLCGYHHRLIHQTTWSVRIDLADGLPEFLPPGRAPDHGDAEWIRCRPRRE